MGNPVPITLVPSAEFITGGYCGGAPGSGGVGGRVGGRLPQDNLNPCLHCNCQVCFKQCSKYPIVCSDTGMPWDNKSMTHFAVALCVHNDCLATLGLTLLWRDQSQTCAPQGTDWAAREADTSISNPLDAAAYTLLLIPTFNQPTKFAETEKRFFSGCFSKRWWWWWLMAGWLTWRPIKWWQCDDKRLGGTKHRCC